MPDEKETKGDASNSPSPEYVQALLEDLKAYDNPEVFTDTSLPEIYKLRITSTLLPQLPTILRAEVHGDFLPDALREAMFTLIKRVPENVNLMQERYGDKDWAEVHALLLAEEEYPQVEQAMRVFFIRNFPKLMVRLYDIIASMSIVYAFGQMFDQPEEINERERLIREALDNQIRIFKNDIKRMLATRSKGRPKIKNPVIGAPEVARQVWQTARLIMGEARGVEAVPGLKEIAHALGTSTDALGKKLTRSKWTWTRIKNDLANLP